jgi:protein associated with RNAse G/E
MFTLSKNFIIVNDGLFQVIRSYPEDKVINVDMVKEWLNVEIIFRKDGNLYFCNTIQELEILN